MNTLSRTIVTAAKAALLASFLLSLAISALESVNFNSVPLIFILSIIITFIISFIMILFTIVPIHELTPKLTVIQKFNRYFPLYAIVFFLACTYIIWNQNFDAITNIIFIIAYITAMQSWVWFFKENKKNIEKNENN